MALLFFFHMNTISYTVYYHSCLLNLSELFPDLTMTDLLDFMLLPDELSNKPVTFVNSYGRLLSKNYLKC